MAILLAVAVRCVCLIRPVDRVFRNAVVVIRRAAGNPGEAKIAAIILRQLAAVVMETLPGPVSLMSGHLMSGIHPGTILVVITRVFHGVLQMEFPGRHVPGLELEPVYRPICHITI